MFPFQETFVHRHEQGTLIEMENEVEQLKRCNDRRHVFQSWVISPLPGLTTAFIKPWLLLVKTPNPAEEITFPSLTDRFTIDMEANVVRPDGTFTLVYLPTTRITNPYEDFEGLETSEIQKAAAFRVDVPRAWQNDDGVNVELDLMSKFRITSAIDDVGSIDLSDTTSQPIVIQWDTFSLTFEAELAALRFLIEDKRLKDRCPSPKSMKAFQMIQNFHNGWRDFYDLHAEFPHLQRPCLFSHQISQVLLRKFKAFNKNHHEAYYGLAKIPNGLYFVNGCPGAGKTEWNMVVAALIQSKPRPKPKPKHSRILFLVDINKTVDDAADRYFTLCRDAGLRLRIVRMHGWPYEMRNSDTLNNTGGDKKDAESETDFTKKFLTTASLARHVGFERNANKAPTLDEAAWDFFLCHQLDRFVKLKKLLERMATEEALGPADWKCLRSMVSQLYQTVLAKTDFVATTPVAAYGSFSRLFRPDVIFIDEAPHARELTTLIPIALFDPIAWIFSGDVKQTRPFVKSGDKRDATRDGLKWNPYAEQLRVSTMARAEMVGAINSKLLVNNRAHGHLHRLPSKMFYEEQMSCGHSEAAGTLYPESTLYLKRHLENMGGVETVNENRVVIQLKDSQEARWRTSFWNPAHHAWLMEHVLLLLKDPNFCSITDAGLPGTIMVATPYSAAVRHYHSETIRWPQELQDRIEVLTVDKAQGNQADVVFLDMVRTTKPGFMDDPQRLNVAITRARQAEIILMHHRMTVRPFRGRTIPTRYLSQIWDDAEAQTRLFTL